MVELLTPTLAQQLTAAATVEFDPFAGPAISHLVPLTEAQAEIWAACLLGGDDANRAYNESVSLRLRGPLSQPALAQAVQMLADRHEALRLALDASGQYSYVMQHLEVPLHYHDLSAKPAPEQVRCVATYVAQEAQHIFDLLHGPLLKISLLRLSTTEHHLVLTAHHMVCDGWSAGILLQELGALYSAYCQGTPPLLPPAESFGQYADEQLAFYHSADYQMVEHFWLQQFRGELTPLTLPTDFPRPAVRTYKSARADYALPAALTAELKQAGLRAGCTFVTTLLVAFEVFLYQLTGQTDLVVGLPAAGQSAAAMPQLVGHCVNLLPLRSQLHPELSFTAYLQQRKSAILDAYEHQQLTFGSLLKKLRLERDASRVPLVPVTFNLDLGLDNNVAFADLTYELRSNPRAYEAFELFLNASGSERALTLEWSYNTALFRPETITRFMADFSALLRRLIDQPGATLRTLTAQPLAPAYHQLNATAQPYPATQNLAQLLAKQAQATPQATALVANGTELTYQQLHQRANQLAHYLRQQGLQPGEIVGLAVERSADLLVALLACVQCGAPYVPLDPSYPTERFAFMLADSRAKLLLASAPLPAAEGVRTLLMAEAQQAAVACPTQALGLALPSTSPLYVLYTSGSTGKPKGVMVSHRNVVNFLHSMQQAPGIAATDRLLAITTISFDIAGLELFLPLVSGATIVLAATEAVRDGRQLLRLLADERITLLQATPSSWRMLLDAGWTTPYPLKALCGGEALPLELAERLLTRCQSVWNLYGPTETTIWSAVQQVQPGAAAVTIGRPIANTQIYVLDEHQRPVPPGKIGELCIAGDGVAEGYLHRPTLTAERFLPNPFTSQPGNRLYRTGDLGQLLASGELQCLGRIDQQVKLRGHRIELGEIEHVLLGLPDVKEAVVVAQQTRPGDERLVAYLVPASPAADTPAQLAQWRHTLGQQLPAYMVPSELRCLPQLPRTLNGKTDRAALARPDAASAPAAPAAGFMAPRTPHEQLVANIWQDCLGLSRLGATDDFFANGGHSLLAVQVMVRLEQATGKRLPLAALLEHPTVEKLAAQLATDNEAATWSSLVPIRPQGRKTPLYIVHGAGLNVLIFRALPPHLHAEQPVYGLQAQGLDGAEVPLSTIEEMAAHYVGAVVAQNPTGPYALAGYSYGGIIAFEMARQLLESGRQVTFLGVFDTDAHQPALEGSWVSKTWRDGMFQTKSLLFKAWLFVRQPKLGLTYYGKLLGRLRYSQAERLSHYEQQHGYSPTIRLLYETAQRKYRLTSQPLHIHLFRATERAYYVADAKFMGWRKFAQAGVSTYNIPGNHFTLFDAPHNQQCAQAIQQALDACAV